MSKISPCLWFDGKAEEAAHFYVSLFADGAILGISRYGQDAPYSAESALMVEFTLAGQAFQALNGGPQYRFTPAISMSVACDDQAEIDRLWRDLSDGGAPGRCGWVTDRFGVSWQIVPEALIRLQKTGDAERVARMNRALLQMSKLDAAALEAAYNA
jgi:predicted 3-demethylubiquinone-9 3-methyltransferase (glyoxalase superfamily)